MKRPAVTVALLAIVILATGLRVYRLRDLPAGLYCDEAANGYNAYSLLRTGRDENGERWPLFVWSFETAYKNPAFIYPAMAPIALFGLDEFSTRLTSAAYGVATVVAVFFLGRALVSPGVGLLSALALAVCPWHLHFSRIAFELIGFPFFFTVGATCLVRFTQGRRTLPLAFFLMGACPYAYGVAQAFVPLFLLGFALLFADKLLHHWRQSLVAGLVLTLTLAPFVLFGLAHPQRAAQRFQDMTFVEPGMSRGDVVFQYWVNYITFLSRDFLFDSGEMILRHSVQGHGELYSCFLPLLLIGAAVALLRRERAPKLVLLWLAVYPVGPSLMFEIPSASHGIIGSVGMCLLAAIGAGAVVELLARPVRSRPIALFLQGAAVAAGLLVLTSQFWHYMRLYLREYPLYSAPGYAGFQYGYRDMIDFMEGERGNYRQMVLTANRVNEPYIFPLFYRPVEPSAFQETMDIGYDIFEAAKFSRYDLDQPILFAVRPSELQLFSDYSIKKRIVAPGGQAEFLVAEVRRRKTFVQSWLSLGVLAAPEEGAPTIADDEPPPVHKHRLFGKSGDIYWRRAQLGDVWLDLNLLYAQADPDHPDKPENVCAYNYSAVHAPAAQPAFLELMGSDDGVLAWFNGNLLADGQDVLELHPLRWPIELRAGANQLLIRSCEREGDWRLAARIADTQGRDVAGVESRAEFASEPPPPPGVGEPLPDAHGAEAGAVQVIEGFEAAIRAPEELPSYPDYRGESDSWRIAAWQEGGDLVWETAACPEQKSTVLVFTVTLAGPPATADLYVDGNYVLSFATREEPEPHVVTRGGYRWAFVPKRVVEGSSGVVYLTVPAAAVSEGEPLELRIEYASGEPEAWFMLKSYRDTAAFEGVTPASAIAAGGVP